jgi:predicted MPP superfamily phosphohydrolase
MRSFPAVNWGFLVFRIFAVGTIFTLLFLSQRYWYRALWRVTSNLGSLALRVAVRLLYVAAFVLIILAASDVVRAGHGRVIPRGSWVNALAGLWITSALFGYFGVLLVRALDFVWTGFRKIRAQRASAQESPSLPLAYAAAEPLIDPSRRYFFRTVTAAAGAAPFFGAVYGFAAERLNYQVRRVEIPIANLPSALDGMQIAQLSDIHLSGYMPRAQVRRAVDMANDLGADLTVVTGDFITHASDPLGDCIEELRRLYAPLGTWGCNGNHEIYAHAEDAAQLYFAQSGMKLLRQENAVLTFKDAQFNLIGVDYQRERTPEGHRQQTLVGVESLVRRDMPNILLSHNPNTFNRATQLGIELSLAGHTHGGQIQVEILDHRLSPARFITDYIAGLYQRPLFLSAPDERGTKSIAREASYHAHAATHSLAPLSSLYVNRGLGTVGAPVRLGVPPEISLLVLRRA